MIWFAFVHIFVFIMSLGTDIKLSLKRTSIRAQQQWELTCVVMVVWKSDRWVTGKSVKEIEMEKTFVVRKSMSIYFKLGIYNFTSWIFVCTKRTIKPKHCKDSYFYMHTNRKIAPSCDSYINAIYWYI